MASAAFAAPDGGLLCAYPTTLPAASTPACSAAGRRRVVVRCRKFPEFIEEGGGRGAPVLQYAARGDAFDAVRVGVRDTLRPFGPASPPSKSAPMGAA